MTARRILSATLTGALCLGLAACQAPAARQEADATGFERDPAALYADRATSGARVYRVDPARSDVRIYAFRGGRAARLGHNHVLSATRFEGYVSLPSAAAADAQFDLRVALQDLVIDDPALREDTGGSFAGPRSASDIEGTRRNLLTRVLDAERDPDVRLQSRRIEGDWPMLVAELAIALNGQVRSQPVLIQVERDDALLHARGELVIRQTDFGITPLSILGGLIAVQDPVVIRFAVTAEALPAQ